MKCSVKCSELRVRQLSELSAHGASWQPNVLLSAKRLHTLALLETAHFVATCWRRMNLVDGYRQTLSQLAK